MSRLAALLLALLLASPGHADDVETQLRDLQRQVRDYRQSLDHG